MDGDERQVSVTRVQVVCRKGGDEETGLTGRDCLDVSTSGETGGHFLSSVEKQ